MRYLTTLAILIFSLVFAISCSGKGNPVALYGSSDIPEDGISAVSPTDDLSDPGVNPYINVFGAWKVAVDMESLTAEVVPSRNSRAIGDIFDCDLSQFLTVNPCSNCMRITSVTLDDWGDINLTIGLKHPFPNLTARPDLHGFDVRTIFIMPSDEEHPNISITLPDTSDVTASYSSALLNSDGLTSHYDSLVTDERYYFDGSDVSGTLNPYLRFFDDFGTGDFDPLVPVGHNVMPTGSGEYYRTAVLDGEKLSGNFVFYLVADVAYGHSATYSNRPTPEYYLPWFNRTEPWRVEYWIEDNELNYFSPTTTAQLYIQVFDWQHGVDVDAEYPDPENPGGIPQSSNIDQIVFSIPGCMDDAIIESDSISGSGTPDDPLEFHIEIINENQASIYQRGLLAIRDELNGETGRMAVPEIPAGFPYDTEDIRDYTMYYEIIVPISTYDNYLNGMYYTDYNLYVPYEDLTISEDSVTHATNIHATHLFDLGHQKFQYQWDYDYDGVTFDVDGEGNPSPDIVHPTPGIHPVGLRVRTTSVPPQEYIYPLNVCTEGEAFNQTYNIGGSPEYSTGYTGGKPMVARDDSFYLAFSREVSSQRDIYLMIGDYFGNAETFRVTDTPAPSNDPSIYIGSSSPLDEVYIVYSEYASGESHIYSTHGEYDGTGFSSGNIEQISDSAGSGTYFVPCLERDANNLHVYFVRIDAGVSRIYHSQSDDSARSWGSEHWFANNGSDYQTNPSVSHDTSSVVLVWEDWMTGMSTDSDIWYARSITGSSANEIRNISCYHEDMIETYPCIDDGYNDTVMTYIAKKPASDEQIICMKYFRYSPLTIMDYPLVENETDTAFLSPAISHLGNFATVVYPVYNPTSDQIYLNATRVERREAFFAWMDPVPIIEDQYLGIADDFFDANPLPTTIGRAPTGYNGFTIIAWRDYTNGSFDSPVVPTQKFGHIDTAMFVKYLD